MILLLTLSVCRHHLLPHLCVRLYLEKHTAFVGRLVVMSTSFRCGICSGYFRLCSPLPLLQAYELNKCPGNWLNDTVLEKTCALSILTCIGHYEASDINAWMLQLIRNIIYSLWNYFLWHRHFYDSTNGQWFSAHMLRGMSPSSPYAPFRKFVIQNVWFKCAGVWW